MSSPMHNSPLTPEQIVELRRVLVAQHGLSDKTERDFDRDCIDGAIGAAIQGAYYLSLEKGSPLDPLHIAGYLLFHIAKKHCFTDGNKRVAWAVVVECLLREGLEIAATENEAADFVLSIANNQTDQRGVLEWLGKEGRLRAYRPNP